ncbi:MAG: hypothetical protein RLZZ76_653 [Candidatus Parcubacteria bacterium]|jgi:hypothetical protein
MSVQWKVDWKYTGDESRFYGKSGHETVEAQSKEGAETTVRSIASKELFGSTRQQFAFEAEAQEVVPTFLLH